MASREPIPASFLFVNSMTILDSIIPPPDLVDKWDEEGTEMFRPQYQQHLTARAAQWGARQAIYRIRCALEQLPIA